MSDEARGSAASAAAEQVRAIVAAAEQSAAGIEAAAREEAERVRTEARVDVAGAREAAERVVERADELARRLEELSAGVRDAVEAMRSDLDALRVAQGAPLPEPEPGAVTASEPVAGADEVDEELIAEVEALSAPEPDVKSPPDAGSGHSPGRGAPAAPEAPPQEPPGAAPAPEGARVLALKMALDGSPRDDTARYLRENFELDDPERLLDEVYAKAGR